MFKTCSIFLYACVQKAVHHLSCFHSYSALQFRPRYSLCSFTNGCNDDFDWTVRRGHTPSCETGPSRDVSGNGN